MLSPKRSPVDFLSKLSRKILEEKDNSGELRTREGTQQSFFSSLLECTWKGASTSSDDRDRERGVWVCLRM